MSTTKATLKSFIEESFLEGTARTTVEDDLSFLEVGLLDSTGVLELVDFLEQQFEISVEDEELIPENLDSINQICTYLESKGVSTG